MIVGSELALSAVTSVQLLSLFLSPALSHCRKVGGLLCLLQGALPQMTSAMIQEQPLGEESRGAPDTVTMLSACEHEHSRAHETHPPYTQAVDAHTVICHQ